MPHAPVADAAVKLAIFNAIWLPIHLLWLAAGVGLHRLELARGTRFLLNAGMAVAMLAVVALAVIAEFR